ncbi:MAG: amidohydrolase, partial [Clostridiales bacterium]|nr:amidohydrolase [Clostridiales bacterium]
MKLLIKQGIVLTMNQTHRELNTDDLDNTGTIYSPGDILIEDGIIKEVSSSIDTSKHNPDQIIDATGLFVLPGIIEAHCHIGITEEKTGKEGDDCNECANPITPYLRALDAVNPMDAAFHEAVKAGITSVMVGPGSSNIVGGQFMFMKTCGSRRIDDLVVLQPAAMKVAFGENPKTLYGDKDVLPTTRMSIAAMLREELFKAKQYYKKKQKAQEKGDDFEEDFHLECYLPVLRKEIPLKAHAHRTDDIITAIRIAKEFDVDLTLDHCSEGHLIVNKIKETGFPAIVGPDLASRSKIEVENMAFKTAGILNKAGITVAITTDHPVSLI